MDTNARQTRQLPPQVGGLDVDVDSDLGYVLAIMQGAVPTADGRLRLPDGRLQGPPAASGKASRRRAMSANAASPTRHAALAAFDVAAAGADGETAGRSKRKARRPYIPMSQQRAFAALPGQCGRTDRVARDLLRQCIGDHSLSEVKDWNGPLPEWLANVVGGVGETAPGRICPRCGKAGRSAQTAADKDGEPRWRCLACGRTYTARTGSFTAGSRQLRLSLGTFLACVLEGRTTGEIGAATGVSRVTAGEWRRHLVSRMMLALGIARSD